MSNIYVILRLTDQSRTVSSPYLCCVIDEEATKMTYFVLKRGITCVKREETRIKSLKLTFLKVTAGCLSATYGIVGSGNPFSRITAKSGESKCLGVC